ncbi:GAF domain-containing protein [Corallincola platygyrae]|uniref:GAF domain-containing protein n=1 Tax=Corallincola platygyrae TaxID=1193278 RepID=A0ABW4XKQ3_9GAMM
MSKKEFYRELLLQAGALIEGEKDDIAVLANLSALIWQRLSDINWAGFYLAKGDELVLGPFQGKPACYRIPFNRGVCGAAVREGRVIRVDDVEQFESHIACDAASNSELVVPLYVNGAIFGVLDIDSPHLARFDLEDEEGLSGFAELIDRALSEPVPQ